MKVKVKCFVYVNVLCYADGMSSTEINFTPGGSCFIVKRNNLIVLFISQI